jgi:hypothetical protein
MVILLKLKLSFYVAFTGKWPFPPASLEYFPRGYPA